MPPVHRAEIRRFPTSAPCNIFPQRGLVPLSQVMAKVLKFTAVSSLILRRTMGGLVMAASTALLGFLHIEICAFV